MFMSIKGGSILDAKSGSVSGANQQAGNDGFVTKASVPAYRATQSAAVAAYNASAFDADEPS